MHRGQLLWHEIAEVAASTGSVERRAESLLEPLARVVPYSAAWIAVRDPETRRHHPVAQDGGTAPLARYFALPDADEEVEQLGLNRFRPPVCASDLPVPREETRAWGEYLLPAGFRDGFAMGLFSNDGRHLGFISLLTEDPASRTTAFSGLMTSLRPLLARAVDRLPSLATAAQRFDDTLGGTVLTRGGSSLPVPGLPEHPLLRSDSRALAVARDHITTSGTRSSFLCPWAGGLVRVTVLSCRDDRIDHLSALVVVRSAGDLAGLDHLDLEIMGALLDGWDPREIAVRSAARDAATRVRSLASLQSLGALLGAARSEGLYIPPEVWPESRDRPRLTSADLA